MDASQPHPMNAHAAAVTPVLRTVLLCDIVESTALVERLIADLGLDIDVAFCPERIAEGKAMVELFELPQIVASRSPRALERAGKLFRNLAPRSSSSSPKKPSSPSSSPTPGATSSSRPRTSST